MSSTLEKFLFQITIFLIPTNLAYHWISKGSYLNGILVDYLIPRIYLSDIPILILLTLWLLKSWKVWSTKKISKSSLVILLTFYLILIRGLLSENPLASTWFWLKITQMSLFFFWIKNHIIKGKSLKDSASLITIPLVASLIFQSVVGLYQVITQGSLGGYWLLGETTLTLSSQIDKVHLGRLIPGLGNSLLMPAYGTTPHNNVLAGFLAIGIIYLYLLTRGLGKIKLYQKLTLYITYLLSTLTLILTFSGTAWMSLLLAFCLIGLSFTHSKLLPRLLTLSASVIIIFITTFPIDTTHPSILRRQKLNQISISMFKEHPFMGVGLNNFTTHMSQYGSLSGNTRFLQPTHNILLLWLAETGLIGLVLFLYILRKLSRTTDYELLTTPILMVLIIGLADHYPLTLQTGQLLMVLSLSIATTKIDTLKP